MDKLLKHNYNVLQTDFNLQLINLQAGGGGSEHSCEMKNVS